MDRILVILAIKNEEMFVERTINSLKIQKLKASKIVVVDDGSSDKTFEIVSSHRNDFKSLEVLKREKGKERSVGPGVVEAFYFGLSKENLSHYDYICKLDGDVEFNENYFHSLIEKFKEDDLLGAASGKPFIIINGKEYPERINDEMVAGQINFYRRACFEDIGGFVKGLNWDAIAFHRARMEGWKTKSFSFENLKFRHLRIMGSSYKNIFVGRVRLGRGHYFMGTHPFYLLGICFYRAFERPFLFGGLLIFYGYLNSFLKRNERYSFPNFRKDLHSWQFERIKKILFLKKI